LKVLPLIVILQIMQSIGVGNLFIGVISSICGHFLVLFGDIEEGGQEKATPQDLYYAVK
jgi:hypothetical protein